MAIRKASMKLAVIYEEIQFIMQEEEGSPVSNYLDLPGRRSQSSVNMPLQPERRQPMRKTFRQKCLDDLRRQGKYEQVLRFQQEQQRIDQNQHIINLLEHQSQDFRKQSHDFRKQSQRLITSLFNTDVRHPMIEYRESRCKRRLIEQQRSEIRRQFLVGINPNKLAKRYGVAHGTIRNIVRGLVRPPKPQK